MSGSAPSLARLIYLSRKSEACSVADLAQILEVAQARNAENRITGLLCFNGDFFLQALEGPPEAINRLYGGILRDQRHFGARLLSYDDTVEDRVFPRWSMGYVHSLDLSPDVLMTFFADGRFRPDLLDGVSALLFLATVAREHAGLSDAQMSRRLTSPGVGAPA
jgi:hypothetical protein